MGYLNIPLKAQDISENNYTFKFKHDEFDSIVNGSSESCVPVRVLEGVNNLLGETEVARGSNAFARISIPRKYY